jgi:hypothetical protein
MMLIFKINADASATSMLGQLMRTLKTGRHLGWSLTNLLRCMTSPFSIRLRTRVKKMII